MVNYLVFISLKLKDSHGRFAWQNSYKMKISLFFKPLMPKVSIFLIALFIICQPAYAQAGFFSDLISKVLGNSTQASEGDTSSNQGITHNSQNIPLPESSINPDLKNIKDEDIPTTPGDQPLLSSNGALGIDKDLDKYDPSAKIITYTVKKGDTLESISNKLQVPKSTILSSNSDLKKGDLLKIGQQLVIIAVKGDIKKTQDKTKTDTLGKNNTKSDKLADNVPPVTTPEINNETTTVSQVNSQVPTNINTENNPANNPQIPAPTTEQSTNGQNSNESTTPTGQPQGTIEGNYVWPFPEGVGRVSQGLHADNAYDFAAPAGTPIFAIQNGTVLIVHSTGYNGGYGKYIVINFNDGRQAIFGHMSKTVAIEGDEVKQGDIIGYVGTTGKSTGPHVHIGFHGDLSNPYLGLKVNSTDVSNND